MKITRTLYRQCIHLAALSIPLAVICGCGGGGGGGTGPGNSAPRSSDPLVEIRGNLDIRHPQNPQFSMRGATARILGIEEAYLIRGKKPVPLGRGTVDDDGAVSITIPDSSLDNSLLYSVEFSCEPSASQNQCRNANPVHAVMSGRRLKQSGWWASALTEIAAGQLAYHVMRRAPEQDVRREMDEVANQLLAPRTPSPIITYEDLLTWYSTMPDAWANVRRRRAIEHVMAGLSEGVDSNELRMRADQAMSPLMGSTSMQAKALDMKVQGHYAYAATGYGGLEIVDIRDPSNPTTVGQYTTKNFAQSVHLADGLAVVTTGNSDIEIFDIRDPGHAVSLGAATGTRSVTQIAVSNAHIFALDGSSNLQIFSLKKPHDARLIGSYSLKGSPQKIEAKGHYLYVSNEEPILQILDVRNPEAPVESAMLGSLAGSCGMTSTDTHLLLSNENFLQFFEISEQDAKPSQVSQLRLSSKDCRVSAHAHTVLSDAGEKGLQVVDISNVKRPFTSGFIHTAAPVTSVAMVDSHIYVADENNGFQILDFNPANTPNLAGRLEPDNRIEDSHFSSNLAYLALGSIGLKIVDVTNPQHPKDIGKLGAVGNVSSLAVSGDTIYLSSPDTGLTVVDASVMGELRKIGPLTEIPISKTKTLHTYGNLLISGHVSKSRGLIKIWDFSSPNNPLVSSVFTNAPVFSLITQGSMLFAATSSEGLNVFDLSNISDPIFISALNTPGLSSSIKLSGPLALMAAGSEGLQILDISNSTLPEAKGKLDTAGDAVDVAVQGSLAYIADGHNGIKIVDISDAGSPIDLAGARTSGFARSISIDGGFVYVTTDIGIDILHAIKAE